MASQGSQSISLKLLIDKKNNKVVMAETDNDFVDILFSFLTMPVGTIVRLISKQPQQAIFGSMTSLYKEVENLEEQLLQTHACKSMLLHPRNPSANECRRLKMNIDDTTAKYYICADYWTNCRQYIGYDYYTTFKNVKCRKCGKMMDKDIYMEKEDVAATSGEDERVFVCGMTKFMVTDDLQVEPMSPATTLTLLQKLGIKDMSSLQETTLSICSEQILNLLKGLLFSKTPLTDVFLRKQDFTSEGLKFEIRDAVQSKSGRSPLDMTMKLTMSKSMNRALYAEAGEDMVNFLLSFLTLPLGSILQFLSGNSSLGSMDNLYKSVECSEVTRADSLRNQLLHPGLCRASYNPLGVNEFEPPSLWCTSYKDPQNKDNSYTCYLTTKPQSNRDRIGEFCRQLLKCPTSETAGQGGFLKGPAKFMITDNLVFTPLVSMWTLSFLKSMKVPLDDLEVRMVRVDGEQALRLLKASLFSKSVLTDVFLNFGLKTPKQEK
ncbi:uncharacterized protein LOC122645954 [Telopea speciosissima]|uniref:uncharacterized protein LOC122645954 n=1 Tax=Telopea speciosissima TaxID=54955 RepID=UPI001CC5531F|nr:uncharacterized protein LOC122645954 [Telopea speciosissima]XP_043695315.1 uncharacterized protein LOC122645954 [Telopea speciosissima]